MLALRCVAVRKTQTPLKRRGLFLQGPSCVGPASAQFQSLRSLAPGVSSQGLRARFYNYERRSRCETCRPTGLVGVHPRCESHGPVLRGTYVRRRVQLLLQSSACSNLWWVCGKSSQASFICFVSLLSKPTFRATIHCGKRNSAAGRENRDIASQDAEFYDKSFMFEVGVSLVFSGRRYCKQARSRT